MKTEQKKNNRLKNILADLVSDEEKKVTTAIKQLRKHGTAEAIVPLLDKYSSSNSESIKSDISSLLFDLKDESVVPEIINAVNSKKYDEIKPFVISILWQAAIDSSSHISTLVSQAIKGDYLTCIEVLTVIESYDTTFNEQEIEDLKFDIDETIESQEEEKQKLLLTIKTVIEGLPVEY